MRLRALILISCLLAISGIAVPTFAHHGVAWYDYSKTVTAKVTVTQFDWGNPHCKIYFDTTDGRKIVRHWIIEMHPPNAMVEHGWTRQSLRSGDVISLSFRPAKNHTTTGLLEEATLPNGITLRQNLLLLPPGQIMSIEEWTRRFASKTPGASLSSTHSYGQGDTQFSGTVSAAPLRPRLRLPLSIQPPRKRTGP